MVCPAGKCAVPTTLAGTGSYITCHPIISQRSHRGCVEGTTYDIGAVHHRGRVEAERGHDAHHELEVRLELFLVVDEGLPFAGRPVVSRELHVWNTDVSGEQTRRCYGWSRYQVVRLETNLALDRRLDLALVAAGSVGVFSKR